MKISITVDDDSIAEKILWFLDTFSNKGIVVKTIDAENDESNLLSDDYIEENWEQMLSKSLEKYDESYYKSNQYKLDRGKYLMEKYQ